MEARLLKEIFEEHCFLARRFLDHSGEKIDKAAKVMLRSLQEGGTLLLFGNGGSAAQATHMAAELTGRFQKERPGLRAVSLAADNAALTAIANDYGYEMVFARQVEALAAKSDAVVAFSTSGHSPNVVEGVRAAKKKGLPVVGLLGREGGKLKELCDVSLVVDGQKTARIQEIHMLLGHVLCEIVEQQMFFRRD